MSIERTSKAAAVVIGGLSIAVMTGGSAYAYWTTSGSGTAAAAAGTVSALEVNDPSVSGLFPTGSVSGGFSVTNPNAFAVVLTEAARGAVTVDAAHAAAGCNAESVTFTTGTLLTTPLAAGDGQATVPFTATMSNAAVDACQGATFSLPLTVTAQSAG